MAVYESKRVTRDGRKYFFKHRYYVKDDPVAKTKISKCFLTYEEAEKEEQKFINKLEKSKDAPVEMTIGELYLSFLEDRKSKVKYTTYEYYPSRHKYIMMFDNLKCIDFDVDHFLMWKKQLTKNVDISLRYKNDLLKFLKSILNYGTIRFNFDFTSVYRRMDKFQDPHYIKKEMKFFTLDEFNKFISGENELRFKCFYSMIYFCGLRCGEARALQWSDLNFNKNIVSITKQVQLPPKDDKQGRKYLITSPKTKTSNRRIPMCDRLVNVLLEYKEELINNHRYNDSSFVFGLDGGKEPISEHLVWYRKNKLCKKTGVKQIRLHDFRHSCASLLINNGANITVVANFLGHSEVEETLNTYSHMFPDALDGVLNVINTLSTKKS